AVAISTRPAPARPPSVRMRSRLLEVAPEALRAHLAAAAVAGRARLPLEPLGALPVVERRRPQPIHVAAAAPAAGLAGNGAFAVTARAGVLVLVDVRHDVLLVSDRDRRGAPLRRSRPRSSCRRRGCRCESGRTRSTPSRRAWCGHSAPGR